ncbi:hypothetical protein [Microbacterium sp. JB110]|uniref:hypothetical protein n=1 Tax=Microbacterium sp. JB110 TaxID=2024477 RepID=UPI000B3536FB|nr:hypothetical protein [Microbacterium sp. JB110]RCS60020.1 hypothetical protein CIK77_11470 [Microbacterium sp. JB110]
MAAPHGLMMAEPDQPESAAEHGGSLVLGFGERIVRIPAGTTFVVGRGADLSIGDNPYVHRRFLEIAQRDGVWWLSNVGSALTASVSSADGAAQSWLAPGSSMPLVFRTTTVMFTGDSTMYEVSLTVESPVYEESVGWNGAGVAGGTAELLSPMQRILLTALAEPLLRDGDGGAARLRSTDEIAARLGWPVEKLERRLGSLCDKFARMGVRGLDRRASGRLLASQRSRLVELAVGTRIVTIVDLELLTAFATQGVDAPAA